MKHSGQEARTEAPSLRLVKDEPMQRVSELYNRYLPELLFLAYQIVGNDEDAEDAVAGVFERLIRIAGEMERSGILSPDGEMVGYLKISVRNACFDMLRVRKRQASLLDRVRVSLGLNRKPEAYERFQQEAMNLMMEELSGRERQILQRHIEGYKNHEIAEELSVSELTVRNTLHNARKRIRKLWRIFMT